MDKVEKQERDAQERIVEDAKQLEKIASKQNLLEQKIAECVENINQLGALPSQDLCEKYHRMSSKTVRFIFRRLIKLLNILISVVQRVGENQ